MSEIHQSSLGFFSSLSADQFDKICLEAIVCHEGNAYIVEKIVDHFNAHDNQKQEKSIQ